MQGVEGGQYVTGGVGGALLLLLGSILGKMIDKQRSPIDEANEVVTMVTDQVKRLDTRMSLVENENVQLRNSNAELRDGNAELRVENAGLRDDIATLKRAQHDMEARERDCRRRTTVLAGLLSDAGLPVPDDVMYGE